MRSGVYSSFYGVLGCLVNLSWQGRKLNGTVVVGGSWH